MSLLTMRQKLLFFTLIGSILAGQTFAADRTNVPLKNWGGFSVNRSWVYDALEKIVLAGLADKVHLNTKPLSRVEAARIVAHAVRQIGWDQYGDYNHRGYLEEILYQLVEEFGPELAEMGVKTPLNRNASTDFLGFKPVTNIEFGLDLTTRSRRLANNLGRRLDKGVNRTSTLEGRIHAGDFFSLYYQPELSWGEARQGRLQSGYAKFTLWNVELEGGRDSLWWGPGFRGSMSISNNTRPLDQIRLSSAEPFHLPWLLSYLGSWKLVTFVAQLEQDRDIPNAKLSGTRVSLAPSRYVELGFNRMFQFGGRGRGISPGQFVKVLAFDQGSDDPASPEQVNNVMSFDATLRIPDVQKYILIARDMTLYGDFGWDDSLFGVIVPDRPGGIVGTYLTGIFGDPKLDLRIEYAQSSEIMFNHFIYTSGYTFRGSVLSHFIGTKGNELYARLTRWMSPDLLLGFQLSQAAIGSPTVDLREKRASLGLDLSYRLSSRSSVSLGYDFSHVKDRGFVAGKSGNDNLFQIQFNRKY
jgi:hypothetical protein